jgi:hypothetical protein
MFLSPARPAKTFLHLAWFVTGECFLMGGIIAAVVSAVMDKDRQGAAPKRQAVVRLPEARPKRSRGATKAAAPSGSQPTLVAKSDAPGSSRVPEAVKAAGAGGTKTAPAGDR